MIQTLNISLAVLPHGIKRGEFAVVGILEGNIVGVVVVVKVTRPLTICFGVHLYLTAVVRQGKIYRLMCRYVYFYSWLLALIPSLYARVKNFNRLSTEIIFS